MTARNRIIQKLLQAEVLTLPSLVKYVKSPWGALSTNLKFSRILPGHDRKGKSY